MNPERQAEGVTYYRIADAPDFYFRCAPYRASLSVKVCSKRWRTAQTAQGFDFERLEHCRGCRVGSCHAGVPPVTYSPLFGLGVCKRCLRGGARFIALYGTCVSCTNRFYEVLKNRNSKNTPPVKLHLDARRLGIVLDGQRVDLRDQYTAHDLEMAVGVLAGVKGRVLFTRSRYGVPTVSTMELAERFRPLDRRQPRVSSARQQQRTIERRAAGIVAREARA
jgi:hypothetical protein